MNKFFRVGLAIASLTLAGFANAATVYSVSSTPTVNCGSAPHGLWTNNYNSAGCNEYYDFQNGSTLTVDGMTAVLDATAMNQAGEIATINITFGGFAQTYGNVKNGGTPNYDPINNPWDFYTGVNSGMISFSTSISDVFTTLLVGQSASTGAASGNKPVFQLGDGANDKSSGFGASAWVDVYDANGTLENGHWDLNMSLTAVPEPGSIAILSLGLIGLGLARRRKK